MESPLQGRTALITGGGGDIGRATAVALAHAGARLVVVDLSAESAQGTLAAVRAAGSEGISITADVSAPEEVGRYVAEARSAYGRIDVFFNNAGIEGAVQRIEDYPVEVFDRVLAINLRGVFLGLKEVIPVMRGQGSGAIINSSSVSGLRGAAGLSAYVASKHAVIGLTRVAAAEVAADGLRVNAVCPGPIDTRMMDAIAALSSPQDPDQAVEDSLARNPSGRWGKPAEVAAVVAFLASDAASYVNGVAWPVDGGRTAV